MHKIVQGLTIGIKDGKALLYMISKIVRRKWHAGLPPERLRSSIEISPHERGRVFDS